MPAPAQNKNLTTRLDAKVKDEAERLFAKPRHDAFRTMNIFLHRALIAGGLPFEVRQESPNAPLAAMEDAVRLANNPNDKRFATVEELMEDLRK